MPSYMTGTEVEQVTLTGNLPYTLPVGLAPNTAHLVEFTQDATGGHTVTYSGQPVAVDLAPGASTVVALHPVAGGYVVRYWPPGGGGFVDEAVALLLHNESATRQALEAPGAVGFQPIAGAPTYVARRILGVVGGALYSSPATEGSRIDRLDGDTWTPVATASGEGHMVRIYGTGDGEILVNRSQSMWKSAGWGAPDVTFSQVVEVRPPA